MTRLEMFCQCLMRKDNCTTVGFIPAKAAVIGNIVGIEFESGLDRGWRVESAGTPVAKDKMRMFERQYKNQRQASDS